MFVTQTKLLVPGLRRDTLSRPRLLDRLTRFLDYKLILATAPAGYGKTTLLADFARQEGNLPVCWFALDKLDVQTERFLAHFIAGLQVQFPECGKVASTLLKNTTDVEKNLDSLIATLVNDVFTHIREHFVFILDDYHFVDGNPTLNRFVSRFAQYVSENCHLVLASRTLPTLPNLALMLARDEVEGLDFEMLAFRPEEIQALMLQNYNQIISDEMAEALAIESEGWITGLRLAAHTLIPKKRDIPRPAFARARATQAAGIGLNDYFAEQVFNTQPSKIQRFLLKTSVLEEFDAELCTAVLGEKPAEWQRLIDDVTNRNLFVISLGDGGREIVRYHHLFRDFLQTELARTDPDIVRSIRRRLAEVHVARQAWDEAYELYRQLGDTAALVTLITQASRALIVHGRVQTLATWVGALPSSVVESDARLLALQGFVAMIYGDQDVMALLDRAIPRLRAQAAHRYLVNALNWRANAHQMAGRYEAALSDCAEVLDRSEDQRHLVAVRAEALRVKASCMLRLGHLTAALECLKQAKRLLVTTDNHKHILLTVCLDLGRAQRALGAYAEAEAAYQLALQYARETNNLMRRANILNNLGVLYHVQGEYVRAAETLQRALQDARQTNYIRIEAYALTSLGDVYLDLDAFEAALDAYRLARPLARQLEDNFLAFYLDVSAVALDRLRGRLDEAQDALEDVQKSVGLNASHYEHGRIQGEAGLLAWQTGELATAAEYLAHAVHHFETAEEWGEAARSSLYLVAVCHALGKSGRVEAGVQALLAYADHLEHPHLLTVAGRMARDALVAVSKKSAVAAPAKRLLRRIEALEADIPSIRRSLRAQLTTVPFEPPHLQIGTLGEETVSLNGETVTAKEWCAQRKVKELFFLLLHHPDGLTKGEIGVTLWPESDDKTLTKQLKNTLYRLRIALGKDSVLFDKYEDRYAFNWELDYDYDVERFNASLAAAERATDVQDQIGAYQQAVDIYKGDYLPLIDADWATPERTMLWTNYREAAAQLIKLYLMIEEPTAAFRECQRLLEQDRFLETIHCLAMRACAKLGDRAAVQRQFDTCCAALDELGVEPLPETVALYENLMHPPYKR